MHELIRLEASRWRKAETISRAYIKQWFYIFGKKIISAGTTGVGRKAESMLSFAQARRIAESWVAVVTDGQAELFRKPFKRSLMVGYSFTKAELF
jgi:hypothetical protein